MNAWIQRNPRCSKLFAFKQLDCTSTLQQLARYYYTRLQGLKERITLRSVGIFSFLNMISTIFRRYIALILIYDVLSSFKLYYIQFKGVTILWGPGEGDLIIQTPYLLCFVSLRFMFILSGDYIQFTWLIGVPQFLPGLPDCSQLPFVFAKKPFRSTLFTKYFSFLFLVLVIFTKSCEQNNVLRYFLFSLIFSFLFSIIGKCGLFSTREEIS